MITISQFCYRKQPHNLLSTADNNNTILLSTEDSNNKILLSTEDINKTILLSNEDNNNTILLSTEDNIEVHSFVLSTENSNTYFQYLLKTAQFCILKR